MGNNLNDALARQGKSPVFGIVVDNDGIYRFRPVGGSAFRFQPVDRCGY